MVELVGFAADSDPTANLSASASGAVSDLAEAGQVLFFGHLVNELGAEDFILT